MNTLSDGNNPVETHKHNEMSSDTAVGNNVAEGNDEDEKEHLNNVENLNMPNYQNNERVDSGTNSVKTVLGRDIEIKDKIDVNLEEDSHIKRDESYEEDISSGERSLRNDEYEVQGGNFIEQQNSDTKHNNDIEHGGQQNSDIDEAERTNDKNKENTNKINAIIEEVGQENENIQANESEDILDSDDKEEETNTEGVLINKDENRIENRINQNKNDGVENENVKNSENASLEELEDNENFESISEESINNVGDGVKQLNNKQLNNDITKGDKKVDLENDVGPSKTYQ